MLGWYSAIVAAVTALTAGEEPSARTAAAVEALSSAVRSSLANRDGTVLADARGRLTDDEIIANSAVMMFGGIETTEGMISTLLVHLLDRPDVLDRVRADRGLLPAAIEESLRLDPAAAVVDRYATVDAVLGGVQVMAGELVRVSISAANRDPELFPAPDEFLLDRPHPRDHLAFVRGPHACLAMDLARLETRAALTAVLDSLPDLRLSRPVPIEGLVFRKPFAVPAAWSRAGSAGDWAAGPGPAAG